MSFGSISTKRRTQFSGNRREGGRGEERFLRKHSDFLLNIGRSSTGGTGMKKNSVTVALSDIHEEYTWTGKK